MPYTPNIAAIEGAREAAWKLTERLYANGSDGLDIAQGLIIAVRDDLQKHHNGQAGEYTQHLGLLLALLAGWD